MAATLPIHAPVPGADDDPRRTALRAIQQAARRMSGPEDMGRVLRETEMQLRRNGVPFSALYVNWVDARRDPPAVRHYVGGRADITHAATGHPGVANILRFWRAGGVHLRRDLLAEDPYGEASYLRRTLPIRCVVDVAFAQGTLAVSHTEPDVYDQERVDFLQDVAMLLELGFHRQQDLADLHAQRQSLEREIEVRIGNERELQRRATISDLRSSIRDLAGTAPTLDGLPKVLRAIRDGLLRLSVDVASVELHLLERDEEEEVVMRTLSPEGGAEWRPARGRPQAACWEAGEIVHRPDLLAADPFDEVPASRVAARLCARSAVDVPLRQGTLAVASRQPRAFDPSLLALLEVLAADLGLLLQRVEDEAAVAERNRLLAASQAISLTVLDPRSSPADILEQVAARIVRSGVLSSVVLALVDRQGGRALVAASFEGGGLRRGEAVGADRKVEIRADDVGTTYPLHGAGVVATVARRSERQVVVPGAEGVDPAGIPPSLRQAPVAYFLPVQLKGRTVAVLGTDSTRAQRRVVERRLGLIQPLLDQVAAAVEYARMHEAALDRAERFNAANRRLQAEMQARHRVEASLQAILDASPDPALLLDRDGRVLTANRAAAREVGVPLGELTGHRAAVLNLLAVGPASDRRGSDGTAVLRQVVDSGQATRCSTRVGDRYVESRFFPVRDVEGPTVSIAVFLVDRSEQIRTAAEVARQAHQIRLVLDHLPALVGYLGPDLRYRTVNEQYARFFGMPVEQFVGLTVASVVGEAVYARALPYLERALAGEAVSFDVTQRSARGRRTLAVAYVPDRDPDEEVAGIFVLARDITQQHLAHRYTEARLSLLRLAADQPLDVFLRRALDEVCAFVDSPVGFCHFVDEEQQGLTLQQWSTRTREEYCRIEAPVGHSTLVQAGLWAECVRARRPVIHNDLSVLAQRAGWPEGHVVLVRELVVPIRRQERVVAILGVGNNPAEYVEEDAEAVAYLADVIWEIAQRKRAAERVRLQERLHLARTAIRVAIAQMHGPADLPRVVAALHAQMEGLGLEVESVSLNLIAPAGDDFVSVGSTLIPDPEHWRQLLQGEDPAGAERRARYPWVLEIYRDQRPRIMARTPPAAVPLGGHSLIEVPLRRGTLAARAPGPDRYAAPDLALVQGFQEVADEALQRFHDLVQRDHSRRRAQEGSRRYMDVLEGERRRMARELHDGVNQLLSAAALRLDLLQGHEGRAADLGTELEAIQSRLHEAIGEIRRLSRELRPKVLDDLGLAAAARSLARQVAQDAGLVIDVRAREVAIPEAQQNALYRILQEALVNVQRHARARRVEVEIRRADDAVVLKVADDGCGFDVEAETAGSGIANMGERVDLLGGRFTLSSGPGTGVRIIAELPLAAG